ncbi:DUF3142 domain-containing protein [Paraburkholderia adhaesiva]|uniref:DUF3142 domain-containing protein n=1 Tax=Paraburkholderia adhaesiva TaxID=2883244 RepID=UPI001F34E5BA|nr:DUF3142 domain-containing protein [Paraburkholderia adhaesiva]
MNSLRSLSRCTCVGVGLIACSLAAWLVVALLHASGPQAHARLPNDAYIWQRIWTPAVVDALRESTGPVQGWHILAAEYDSGPGGERWSSVSPDWRALSALNAPVTAVFRIDGHVERWDGAALATDIAVRLATWRARGVTVAGVEIDYDCATSHLADYARFLQTLRGAISTDGAIHLTVTALPTWLQSPELDVLLASSDEAVLQLHAVMNPVEGLFDPERAFRWAAAFAQRTSRPWRVALPAYGSRVTWGVDGRIVAIESERPTLYPGGVAHELVASPDVVRAFVARLDSQRPRGLAGIVWFRLPTDADARAWSLATWRAVLARDSLSGQLDVIAHPSTQAGLYDVSLVARGNADMPLPRIVRLARTCTVGDGINGYALDYDAQGMLLRRAQPGLLRAGNQLNIGWLRCSTAPSSKVTFHVEP